MRVDKSQSNINVDVKVHNVIILDGSGSMSGSKYNSAKKGIELDLQTCRDENFASYTFVEFNDTYSITTHCFMTLLTSVKLNFNGANSSTPLYRTVGETLERLLEVVSSQDKVLVKIFTDGGENTSTGKYKDPLVLADLIKKCEERGFTITFIGTKIDTETIVNSLKINSTNTLVHNNTGEGVATAFNVQAEATRGYSKRLKEGEDVTIGFYSKTVNN